MSIKSDIRTLLHKKTQLENSLSTINTKIAGIENELQSLSETKAEVCRIRGALADQATGTASLLTRSDGLENRSRRCNLLFPGIPGTRGESWSSPEHKVLEFTEEQFGISLASSDIERAHRVGSFQEGKKPTNHHLFCVKVKIKSEILQSSFRLKGSSFSLSEYVLRKYSCCTP